MTENAATPKGRRLGISRLQSLEDRLTDMVDQLERLVNAESPSAHLPAVVACVEAAAEMGEDLLGAEPEWIWTGHRPHLRWAFGDEPRILLLAHLDTVWPLGTIERIPFAISEGRATGPGVFDMKAGFVQGLFALNTLPDLSGITLLLNSDEESSSPLSREIIEETAQAVDAVLVLEPSERGHLKASRKGVSRYTVGIRGAAAHPGLDPEAGVNALSELAHQVLAVEALSDVGAGTLVTPTVAEAGTSANTVPASASFKVDVRCASTAEQQRVDRKIRTQVKSVTGADLTVEGGLTRPVFDATMSASLVKRALVIADHLGLAGISAVGVGGGSDGNFTAAMGVPTLDGLGPVGGGAHAEGEHILVKSMPERAALVAELCIDLLDRPDDGVNIE